MPKLLDIEGKDMLLFIFWGYKNANKVVCSFIIKKKKKLYVPL